MDNLILSPIPLDALLQSFREIIKEEVKAEYSAKEEGILLSPAEVCSLFKPKISLVTLSTWTREGKLSAGKLGGRVWYKKGEVLEAVQVLKRYKT